MDMLNHLPVDGGSGVGGLGSVLTLIGVRIRVQIRVRDWGSKMGLNQGRNAGWVG